MIMGSEDPAWHVYEEQEEAEAYCLAFPKFIPMDKRSNRELELHQDKVSGPPGEKNKETA